MTQSPDDFQVVRTLEHAAWLIIEHIDHTAPAGEIRSHFEAFFNPGSLPSDDVLRGLLYDAWSDSFEE